MLLVGCHSPQSMAISRFRRRCKVNLLTLHSSNCNHFNAIRPQSDDDSIDQSSFTISNNGSLPDASSSHEADGQSTEGDRSTDSKTSSNASDSPRNHDRTKANHDDKLEAFIKEDVLRTDPAVADEFYQNVIGKLEYSSPEYTEPVDSRHELSLLDLLEFEAFSLVQHSEAPTECPASSTGPSPSSSGTQRRESAPTSEQSSSSKLSAFFTTAQPSGLLQHYFLRC